MPDFLARTEAYIADWHGIAAPNDPARRLAAELAATIQAFEAQRGRLQFEDEPSSFEAALLACREPACKEPACREPACREPACREPACREPACREPACREPACREPG